MRASARQHGSAHVLNSGKYLVPLTWFCAATETEKVSAKPRTLRFPIKACSQLATLRIPRAACYIEERNEWLNERMTHWFRDWMNEEWNYSKQNEMKWPWHNMKKKWHEPKCMNKLIWSTLSSKIGLRRSILYGFDAKSSSRYSLVLVWCTFCRPDLPKVLWDPYALTILMWNRASLQSWCTCCRPHLQKVVWDPEFFLICMWNRALATVWCPFSRLHVSKGIETPHFLIFMWNRAPAKVLRAYCRQVLPIEARNCGNRDTSTLATTEAIFPKSPGFRAREYVFSSLDSYVPDLLPFPTWWRDDLVDMMMWCRYGWQDDVVAMMVRKLAAGHDNPSVTRKFSN